MEASLREAHDHGESKEEQQFVWVWHGATEHPAFLLSSSSLNEPTVEIQWQTGKGHTETVNSSLVRLDPGWSERATNRQQRSTRLSSGCEIRPPHRHAVFVTPSPPPLKKVASKKRNNNATLHASKKMLELESPGDKFTRNSKRPRYDSSGTNRIRYSNGYAVVDDIGNDHSKASRDKSGPNVVYKSQDNEEVYWEVEKILKRKVVNGVVKYQIKWQGVDEITWEPEAHLCDSVLEEAEAKFRGRTATEDDMSVSTDAKPGPNLVYKSQDSEEVYWEVEKILKRKVVKGVEKFQVKWAGVDEITWEPKEHLCESVWQEAKTRFQGGTDEEEEPIRGEIVCVDTEKNSYCSDDSEKDVVYWEVDRILKRKMCKGEEFFLVKWKGESTKPSWEPAENLCDTAIEEARERFQTSSEDDEPFVLTTTTHVIENFQELPDVTDEAKVVWNNEPTPDTSVNFTYLLEDAMEKKLSRKWPARRAPKVLEMFAGVGGMSQGFLAAGFETKWLVEKNALSAVRQKMLHPHAQVYEEDVGTFLEKAEDGIEGYPSPEEVDHVHASPPCQGFSRANRYGGRDQAKNNELSYSFIKAVKYLKPITATLENVEGMFQTKHLPFMRKIISKLIKMDYQVRICVLDASSYGDPQQRRRLFVFASLKDWPLPPVPPATHGEREGLKPCVTVRDALHDLEQIPVTNGNGLIATRDGTQVYNHQASEILYNDLSERIDPDIPSFTILTTGRRTHYKLNRLLSVREVARLMSFPDDFQFFGTATDQYAQLGNAVPVNLATAVAASVASTYGK